MSKKVVVDHTDLACNSMGPMAWAAWASAVLHLQGGLDVGAEPFGDWQA